MASPCWVWNFGRASRDNSLFICYGFAFLEMLAFAVIFFDMNGSRRSCCSGDVRSVLFKLFNLGIGFKFEFWIWWSLSFCLIEDLSLSLSFCLKEDLRKEKKEKRKKKKKKTGYRWLKNLHCWWRNSIILIQSPRVMRALDRQRVAQLLE